MGSNLNDSEFIMNAYLFVNVSRRLINQKLVLTIPRFIARNTWNLRTWCTLNEKYDG
jgi:hypothetical protein